MDTTETTDVTLRRTGLARGPLMRWRSVDLVTAAVLGVAFGVVFWGWAFLYTVLEPLFKGFPPAGALVAGVWLLPAVVGALVIRRPGAALLTELVAANIELLLGNGWGATVFISGTLQGLGVEIAVALFLWRRWTLGVAMLAGVLAATLETVYEVNVYYDLSTGYDLAYLGAFALSGALFAGPGGWLLVRALARAGALRRFPAGAEQRARVGD